MNLQQLAHQLLHSFAQALGWRAANMMPPWVVILLLVLAVVAGVKL
jgi:hypothetical protein